MLPVFPHSCPFPFLTTQDQGVSGDIVQEAGMSSQVGGVPEGGIGVGSGGWGSLIKAWGPGKEVMGALLVGVHIYFTTPSFLPSE